MTKRIEVASEPGEIDEDSYAAIYRDLADISRRLKGASPKKRAELAVEVGWARQRMIAVARRKGGATFARLMRPRVENAGGNVMVFRRRR